jgi:hypothetical protein
VDDDRIVAWTALPMSFASMSLIEGKFKLPLLRGEHSPHIQHFRSMEQIIARDLDAWLCNIYFEVTNVQSALVASPIVELTSILDLGTSDAS